MCLQQRMFKEWGNGHRIHTKPHFYIVEGIVKIVNVLIEKNFVIDFCKIPLQCLCYSAELSVNARVVQLKSP